MFATPVAVGYRGFSIAWYAPRLRPPRVGLPAHTPDRMPSTRYTILLADRQTGVVRRFTVGLRPALCRAGHGAALPVLIGMGAAWKAKADVADLYASHATLNLELSNYRATTEALTGQIQGLQTALDDLGGRRPSTRPCAPRWTSCPPS